MNVRGMQYDIKQKLNKIDSEQYRNLRVPELDWKINEAYEIYVKSIAQPRVNNHLGFEINQRTTDDIRTIVVDDLVIVPTVLTSTTYSVTLPDNYMFYISAEAIIEREGCPARTAICTVRQHDDLHEISPFDKSSFDFNICTPRPSYPSFPNL